MQQTIVKTYNGSQQQATNAYQTDAAKMAQEGYVPTSQVWAAGSYGCGSFIVALLLCFILIGILVFIYMLIVKPAGTLTVTYTLAPRVDPEKVCPKCAERVKAAAAVCRFCGHTFENVPAAAFSAPARTTASPAQSGAEKLGRKFGRLFAKKPPQK